MQEIERKFLVKRDGAFKAEASSASEIAQGYMDVKGATVRIRLRDDRAYLTIKSPSRDGGLSRYELETLSWRSDREDSLPRALRGPRIRG